MLWVLWVRLSYAVGVAPFRLYFFFFLPSGRQLLLGDPREAGLCRPLRWETQQGNVAGANLGSSRVCTFPSEVQPW